VGCEAPSRRTVRLYPAITGTVPTAYLDRGTASRAAYLLAALSRACHYHPYELAPTAAELLGWLDETAQIVTRIQAASAAPASHS
jgi:hypothetical protein